ncbi:MAG TPA: cytochrome P450 [Mycobacteriales bacterium]|nr:cytochrome P450 [Mycobacteriales bacterium]
MTAATTTQADADAATVFDPDAWTSGAPYDALDRLRADSPVHRVELRDLPPIWLLTRHDDVIRVSRDDATFSSSTGNTFVPTRPNPDSAMLPGLDPPRHTTIRRLVNQGFTARNVARLEDRLREIARDIVDRVLELGEFDAVPAISAEMSLQVIAEVLGVPQADRLKIFDWSNAIGSLGIEDPDYAPDPSALREAGMAMFAYCQDLIAERRRDEANAVTPRDDILSALLAARVDGEALTDAQLNEFFLLLAVAGNETTRNTLSHSIHALSDHPDQRARLATPGGTTPAVVDELLRWSTPVLHFRRTATADTELGGQRIAAGDWVAMHYLSANRDERAFPDPYRLDLGREPGPHVAFGGLGTHFCLGAQLAKLEIKVMLDELYTRAPHLTVTGEPKRLRSAFFHGIKSLPCAVSA